MTQVTPDWIGWLATALFLASYFCKDQRNLRRLQGLAAVLWVAYGTILHAIPIVVANLLVAGVALYSSSRTGAVPKKLPPKQLPDVGLSPASAPDLSRIS